MRSGPRRGAAMPVARPNVAKGGARCGGGDTSKPGGAQCGTSRSGARHTSKAPQPETSREQG
jgi:hypothetical protein